MALYRVKVTSGEYAGRVLGPNIGQGIVTNPELLKSREVRLGNTEFSLYAQERAGTAFFPDKAQQVQKLLTSLGLTSELVEA